MIIKGLMPAFLLFTMQCNDAPNIDCKPGNAGVYATLVQCVAAKEQLPAAVTDAQCKQINREPK